MNPMDAYDGQQSGDEFRCKDCAAMRDHNCRGVQKEYPDVEGVIVQKNDRGYWERFPARTGGDFGR